AIEELGLKPWLLLGMRLGEGSGCPIAFQIMKAACAAMNGTALFGEESVIDDSYLEDIRKGDSFTV
ncbi:MAG: nicotinate-nucleotide--dimethylbenzimidazole phosphoribosyltransferase, partial [Firmicutes bacterium]|nr:nicotinate-nucleotide--dimethylbenzimidazole phosphoribosyltransferase [Bacillota bacterium]